MSEGDRLLNADGYRMIRPDGRAALSDGAGDECCCGGGDCCRVGKVCFGTASASTLALSRATINTVDLSSIGLSSTARVHVGAYDLAGTPTYVVPAGGALSATFTTLGCAESQTGWVRMTTGTPGSFVNGWCRVTIWYSADDNWRAKFEFAGASDGSGTIVTIEGARAFSGRVADSDTAPSDETLTWDNGSAGKLRLTNSTTCCRNGSTCQTGSSTDDSVGVYCCDPPYCTPSVDCGPFPELATDYVIRCSDSAKVFLVGGKRHQLSDSGTTFCDVPDGKTLLEPLDPQPSEGAWGCIPFAKCTGEDGTTSEARSLLVPSPITLNEYGSIFTNATGPGCEYGPPHENVPDDIPLDDANDQWRFDTYGSDASFNCGPEYGSWQMPDLTGWCSIDVMIVLVSECAYYEEVGWDEELMEPIFDLIPAKQYYECLFRIGCNIVFSVLYRSGAFDPSDPETPGFIGDFSHVSTDGTPPGGMSVAPTISFTSAW